MSPTKLAIPATTKAPAAEVEIDEQGVVTLDSRVLGTIGRGAYSYSPVAAGHSGRVARFHAQVGQWVAVTPDGREFKGGDWKSARKKNTRKAAAAFLIAAAKGADSPDYFYWL